MKFQPQVEAIYNKFIQNTVCGTQLNEYQLTAVKNYFQKCWETGFAQGYADGFYENQSHENDQDNPDNMGPDVKFIDDICEALNS